VARPRWLLDHDLDCNSCHTSPPADHYDGPCTPCHVEANADGTALVPGPMHANGRVDLGDGSGGCGACHGAGDDPWPRTGAHQAHAHPSDALAVACADCHQVPMRVEDAGHLDHVPGAEVTLGARASARGATPVREGTTCREVACHGAGLAGGLAPPPVWTDTDGTSSRCGACHAVPPPPPHTRDEGCSAVTCHGGYVTPDGHLSELGRSVHTDGVINLWSAR
jgi:predicted CxxxxCH...CXXCH cytochrome family protein